MNPNLYNKISGGRVEQVFQTNKHVGILRFDNEKFTTLIDGEVTFTTDKDGSTIDTNVITATTLNATTFDTNVAAAGVTLAGTTLSADGTSANIDIDITPKGSGEVNITKVDIDSGTIDSTVIGGTTPLAGTFTTLRTGNGSASTPSMGFADDPDTGIFWSTTNAIGFTTGGVEKWLINSSGAINPILDNSYNIGGLATSVQNAYVGGSIIKKGIDATTGYGQLAIKSISASKTLTNAQTNTLAIQIPTGAKIIGTQLRNDTAIAGVDDATGLTAITTYTALYATGATQNITTTAAVGANTTTNTFFNSNAATDITTGLTDITLDAGVGNKFTAGGVISAVTYYYLLTSITSL
jgi:hypothetical protein